MAGFCISNYEEGNRMEIKLYDLKEQKNTKDRTSPVEYFNQCPRCHERKLIKVFPDVLCSTCDWDSLAWDVSRGAMDNITQAVKEVFVTTKPTVEYKQENQSINLKNRTRIGA